MYDTRVSDDRDILGLLRREYRVVGVIKRRASAKKGIYDGLAVVERDPGSEIAMEYVGIAKRIADGELEREAE